jgi:2-polyprenyl-3-methyl-5-hydroxy-6-metoxy-1,4-benzoquinol methylase
MQASVGENVFVASCPGCGATQFKATGPEAPGFSMEVAGRKFQQSDYFVRECLSCGLLYRTPTLSDESLAEYYALVPFQKWEATGYHPIERAVLSVLKSLPRGSRILDYGCSSGRLLSGLRDEYECYGSEVNSVAAGEASTRGLKMIEPGDLAGDLPVKFDAIVLVDVFEHLRKPLLLLRQLMQHASDNALLVIATGNGDAAACRRDPAQFWYFRTLEHLSMMTERHAQHLAAAVGLSLEVLTKVCHYDLSVREKLVLWLHDFVYWQFRRRTFLARTLLPLLPKIRNAGTWTSAPPYTCTRDHVVAVFRGDEKITEIASTIRSDYSLGKSDCSI